MGAAVTKSINIKEHHFILDPSGAVFWPKMKTLVLSDVHLGKISHFRKAGSAVPQRAIWRNFERMDQLISRFTPQRIVFLGDLFHSSINVEWQMFSQWRESISVPLLLVEGNHDILERTHYQELGMVVVPRYISEGFVFTHHPSETDELFNFCGHLHPGIKLTGLGRQHLSLPCFLKREHQLILPAFGEFTGKMHLHPNPGDAVFAITGKEVLQIH